MPGPLNSLCNIYTGVGLAQGPLRIANVPCRIIPERRVIELGSNPFPITWTHYLIVDPLLDIRDGFSVSSTFEPGIDSDWVELPAGGTVLWGVSLVTLAFRGEPNAFKKVYLARRTVGSD